MLRAKTPEHVAFAKALEAHLESLPEKLALTLEGAGTSSLAAWFLGPKAENEGLFAELVAEAIARHCQDRRSYYPDDPPYVTEKMKNSREYKRSVADFRHHLDVLLKQLQGSVPFFSYRYQAHMNWDITMPGLLGY
ncbi:MAG TPA: hypothetical protein VJU82_01720, partial [Acidobacteriaceae bacterium]|nr:hypothetical protein [Acidobacteriaceae bacterium]